MITTQDIREKTFEKSTFGGYAMGEVDDFLDELANDLAANQKEMAALRGKMKVLVDKIKEYQATEEAMRMALVSAQKIAKDIEDDSQSKADAILADARKEAEDIVAAAQAEADRISGGIRERADAEELRYQKAKAAAADYIQKLRMLCDKEQAFLTAIQDADLSGAIVTPAPAEKKAIPAPAQEPEAEEYPEEPEEDAAAPEEPEEEAEEEAAPAPEPPAPRKEAARKEPASRKEPARSTPDYLRDFEAAVYKTASRRKAAPPPEEIPEEEDDSTAPMFRF